MTGPNAKLRRLRLTVEWDARVPVDAVSNVHVRPGTPSADVTFERNGFRVSYPVDAMVCLAELPETEPQRTESAEEHAEFQRLVTAAIERHERRRHGEPEPQRTESADAKLRRLHEKFRPFDEWHEADGAVLWTTLPIVEPPWCGTPLDEDWPWLLTSPSDTWWLPLPSEFDEPPEPMGCNGVVEVSQETMDALLAQPPRRETLEDEIARLYGHGGRP